MTIPRYAYQHSADREAIAALQRIPYLDTLIRRLADLRWERKGRNRHLASSVRLGPDQLPEVWRLCTEACEVLGVDPVPDLYLTNDYEINAYAFGAHQPIIVLNSEIVSAFDQPSLAAVIAHEVGHIHCDHVMYKNMAEMLLRLSGQVVPSVMTGLPVAALSLAFASWDRSSELSSDRAAAIVSQDPEAVCRMLMYLAAGGSAHSLSLEAFVQQGRDYEAPSNLLDEIHRLLHRTGATHPLSVLRVRALLDWVDAGGLGKVIAGDYSGVEPTVVPPAGSRTLDSIPPLLRLESRSRAVPRPASEFDQLARAKSDPTDEDDISDESEMSPDELSDRIANWLEQHGGVDDSDEPQSAAD